MCAVYREIRDSLKSGDVIAFSGKGRVSELIKWRTRSPYSHVGLVYRAAITDCDMTAEHTVVYLIESTTMIGEATQFIPGTHGFVPERTYRKGLQMVLLSQRLEDYKGEVWVSKLDKGARKVMRENSRLVAGAWNQAFEWLRARIPYDAVQAIGAGIDWWDRFFENEEDFSALFCSEFCAAIFKRMGLLEDTFNASEATPSDVMQFTFLEKVVSLQKACQTVV